MKQTYSRLKSPFSKIVRTLVVLIVTAFSFQARATHMMGADITYKCLDSLKYQFIVKVYRDCRGVPLSTPASSMRCAAGGSQVSVALKRTGIRDVTPVCANTTNPCNPSNTRASKGIEEHSYTVTVDFSKAPYKNLLNCKPSCEIIFQTGQCCRNGAINTGAANQNFYTFAMLNPCKGKPCNSSPALTTEPVAFLCCNQPYFYNNGALDVADFDSLSYSWSQPLRAKGAGISYSPPYKYTLPFKVYDPSGTGYTNPNVNPPLGLYLDPETGDIIFTPTKCNEVTVAVMEIKEWRKNSKGVYEHIGTTRRDMQFWVETCPGNNPPTIKGPFSYTVCAGEQLCFTVTTDDKPKTIPGQPTPPKDTVTISWNKGIPGATFTVVNKKALHQSGKFCWTPPENAARTLPYSFTVRARDDACPLNAQSVRAFSIKVKHRAKTDRIITKLKCGRYAIESKVPDGFQGTPSYQWLLLDSNGLTLFDRKKAFLEGTNSFISNSKTDTILFRAGGKYIVKHTIDNPPLRCPTIYYDTILVPPVLEADLAFGPDTFVCAGNSLNIAPRVTNGLAPIKYLWSTGDTTSYVDVVVPEWTPDTTVGVYITDANGCTAWDSTTIFLKENPLVFIGPDRRICTYDTIHLIPNDSLAYWDDPRDTNEIRIRQGDTLYKEWFHNGTSISTDSQLVANVAGQYIITVRDSLGCTASDTMILMVNDTVVANAGLDQTLCYNDTLTLTAGGLDTMGNGKSGTYRWWDITSNAPIDANMGTDSVLKFAIFKSTDYKLDLYVTEDTTTCSDNDTVAITVNALPVLNLPGDMTECCDVGYINLNNSALSPKGGKWYNTLNPSYVELEYRFNSNTACDPDAETQHMQTYEYVDPSTGCVNKDSMKITLNPLPRLRLSDGYFCQDKGTVDLQEILVLPAKLTGPSRTVNCLECGSYDFSKIKKESGPTFDKQFSFDISTSAMNLGNKDQDSITIELIYGDANGCFVRDTATIVVTKVPVIKFLEIPDMCWDEGKVDLKQRTAVTPTDGFWFCYDTTLAMPGFRYCADSFMNGALTNDIFGGDTINTLATNPLGGTYYMRYMHTRSGCPTFRDTFMTINPLPKPQIDVTVLDDNLASGYVPPPYLFCEDRADISMVATPGGGQWSSPHAGVVTGNTFKPSTAPTKTPFYITYLYTDANGCKGADSAQVEIEAKPTLSLSLTDSSLCRTDNMNIDLTATFTNTPDVDWFAITGGAVSPPTGANVNYSFSAGNDTSKVHVLVARTKEGNACPYTEERFIAQIHPVPDANITPDIDNGCQPHMANITTSFNNKVDPLTSTYEWNFGDGGTASDQNPAYLFNQVGVNDVSLTITTIHGCDTTLTMPITVHPIPVADFTPNPNNSTTAALPKFTFNNESTIASGSIVSNYWDMGEAGKSDDTSTQVSHTYFYPSDTGSYWVSLTVVSEFGCRDSISKPVIIGPDILVFIPNAFSPDGGGPNENDGFRAEVNDAVRDYHMIVFDRWGEILWESKDPSERWDGTYKGLPAQQDVYAYHLNVTSWDDKVYKYSGTITLIR